MNSRLAMSAMVLTALTVVFTPAPPVMGQGALFLEDLTVPQPRLVSGCRLAVSPAVATPEGRVRGGLWAGLPIPNNPWRGSDRAILAAIRERVVSPSPLPDGPPLTAAATSQLRLQRAEDVEEGYAAIYEGSDSLVTVYGLRFTSDRVPELPVQYPRSPGTFRSVRGRTVVVVSGNGGPCLRAVSGYVGTVTTR